MRQSFPRPVIAVFFLMVAGATWAADEDYADIPELAADLKLLQGKWEMIHRREGSGPPNLRSTKEISGRKETLRRFELDSGKLIYEHTVEIALSKSGNVHVVTFHAVGGKPDDGLSGIYKVDAENLFDVPGLLQGKEYRNYAPTPTVFHWRRAKEEEVVEKTVEEPRVGPPRITDVALVDDGKEMIVAEGNFIEPGMIYTVNLQTGWRGAYFPLAKGCASLAAIPSRNEVASAAWDSTIRIHSLPTLAERLAIPVDRSASRIDVSPDGKMLAVVLEGHSDKDQSPGRSLDLYDVESGKLIKNLDKDLLREFDIKFSPDGRDLAVCGGVFENPAGEIIIYDVAKGIRKGRAATTGTLWNLGYSSDGKWVVATGIPGTMVVDAQTAVVKASVKISGYRVQVLPGKDQVVFSDGRGFLQVAQMPDLKILKSVQTEQGLIGGLAIRNNSEELIAAGFVSTRIWKTSDWTSTELMINRVPALSGKTVTHVPLGPFVAVTNGKQVQILDEQSQRVWNTWTLPNEVRQVRAHASQNQLGAALSDGTVHVLDATTGTSMAAGNVPNPELSILSGDLKAQISISEDQQVTRRQLNDNSERRSNAKFGARFSTLASSRGGAILCGLAPGAAAVISPDANRQIVRIMKAVPAAVVCMDWFDSTQRLALADQNGNLAIWAVDSNGPPKALRQVSLGSAPTTLIFSRKGDQIAIGLADGSVSVVEVDGTLPLQKLTRRTFKPVVNLVWMNGDRDILFTSIDGQLRRALVPSNQLILMHKIEGLEKQQTRSACFSGDAEECFVANGRSIEVRSTQSWEIKQVLEGHRDTIHRIRLSRDGKTIASTGADKLVQLRTKNTAQDPWVIDRTLFLEAPGRRLEWSPDGRWLIVGLSIQQFDVYDTATWEAVHRIKLPYIANAFAFSNDSKTLYTAGFTPAQSTYPSAIQIWDTQTWKDPRMSQGHRNGIESIAMAPDGKSLYSTGADSMLIRWAADSGQTFPIRFLPKSGSTLSLLNNSRFAIASWHFANLGIVDLLDGKIVTETEGHTDSNEAIMLDVMLSNDGRYAVSCSVSNRDTGNGSVKLWRFGAFNRIAAR